MTKAETKDKDPAADKAAAYAAAAEPFRHAIALACDFASEAGMTGHEQANELWAIAQACRDGTRGKP